MLIKTIGCLTGDEETEKKAHIHGEHSRSPARCARDTALSTMEEVPT